MEGRLWGLWVLCGCCSLLLFLLPACAHSPAETPEKKSLWDNQERFFFFTCDETSKWRRLFLFALAHCFIHFELFLMIVNSLTPDISEMMPFQNGLFSLSW